MDNNEKDFSPQESLQLIRNMIESTRTSMSDKSHYFLLWGYATMIGCISQYILLAIIKYPKHYYAWLVTIIALFVHVIFILNDKKRETVRTYISDANNYTWTIIGLAYLALFFVFARIGWQYCFPFYILLYGIGTYITGSLLNFKPMKMGAIACMFLVIVAPYLQYEIQILLSAFAILISYIIPGHLLRNQYQHTNKTPHGK